MNLVSLFSGVTEAMEEILLDRCGSHVIEALIKKESNAKSGNQQGLEQDFEDTSVVLQVARFCRRNVWKCISHVYCSHVIRTLLQSLSGVEVGGKGKHTRGIRAGHVRAVCNVPDRYAKALCRLARSVRKSEELGDMMTDANASHVLQVLMSVLHQRDPPSTVKLVSRLVTASGLLEQSQDNTSLPPLLCSTFGSHTAETLLQVATEDVIQLVYTSAFRHRLLPLALHSNANFVLQQFLTSASIEQVCSWIGCSATHHSLLSNFRTSTSPQSAY